MLTIHRILSSAIITCKQKTVGKPRKIRFLLCACADETLFYALVKDEFNKNNNVCFLHIPMEYLSSFFETLFETYLNAIKTININNSYKQFI